MKHLLTFLFIACSFYAMAQKPVSPKKAYKPIRVALKAKKPTDALTTIKKLAADTNYNRDPKLYAYGVEAEKMLFESLNEKMYLNQKIDTAEFFVVNNDLCRYILRCDTAEQYQQKLLEAEEAKKGKASQKNTYRKQHSLLLRQFYPNLSAAGRFHYSKRQFAQARKYFNFYFEVPKHPMWVGGQDIEASSTYKENIYLDFKAMFELKQFDEMPRYGDVLLADSVLHNQVLELLAHAAYERGDSAEYIRLVKQGLSEQPSRIDYFAILANNYTEHGKYEEAIALADTLLVLDPLNKYYLECRCYSLFKLGRLEESKIAAERLVDLDSLSTEANYVLGYYYIHQAEQVELPRHTRTNLYRSAKKKQIALFKQARPYMERFREQMPEERERWAPLLYKIYLNLNLGKEFEEIEQIMGKESQ